MNLVRGAAFAALSFCASVYAQTPHFVPGQVLTAAQLNSMWASTMPKAGGAFSGAVTAPALEASSVTATSFAVLGSGSFSGAVTFSSRPLFNGATPWDTANFNPMSYATLTGAAFTGPVTFNTRPSFNGATPWDSANFTPPAPILSGLTGNIGGGLLVVGACTQGTASVAGASVGMVAAANPNTYPGDGLTWRAYVSTANVVTVKVCAVVAVTPTATTYNVRVVP